MEALRRISRKSHIEAAFCFVPLENYHRPIGVAVTDVTENSLATPPIIIITWEEGKRYYTATTPLEEHRYHLFFNKNKNRMREIEPIQSTPFPDLVGC